MDLSGKRRRLFARVVVSVPSEQINATANEVLVSKDIDIGYDDSDVHW